MLKSFLFMKINSLEFKYVDYLHLDKFNGERKIVKVIWEFRPDIQ